MHITGSAVVIGPVNNLETIIMLFLLAFALFIGTCFGSQCPCDDSSLCQPIHGKREEVLGFSTDQIAWEAIDLGIATTIAWNTNSTLYCLAHSKGVRVVMRADFNTSIFNDDAAMQAWITAAVQVAVDNGLDGINFDYEVGGADVSSLMRHVAFLVACIDGDLVPYRAQQLHSCELYQFACEDGRSIPYCYSFFAGACQGRWLLSNVMSFCCDGIKVTVDVPWGPFGIDGRFYDWISMAEHLDYLFVMAYDTRSQIYGPCLASANTPISVASLGIQQYLDIGIPAEKLILGLPWYGYVYPCENGTAFEQKLAKTEEDTPSDCDHRYCAIKAVPFRGAPCSDAAGFEVGWSGIQKMLANTSLTKTQVDVSSYRITHEAKVSYDEALEAPWFNYKEGETVYQVWYDNSESLGRKFQLAKSFNLGGVGVWNFDSIYLEAPTSQQQQQQRDMWAAINVYRS